MKPEHRFDEHVHRRGEIVATTNVREFVREDGAHLVIIEPGIDVARPQKHRPDDAKYARFEGRIRRDERQSRWRAQTGKSVTHVPR